MITVGLLSQLGLALGGTDEPWWEREVGKERRKDGPEVSPSGWSPSAPEGRNEVVFSLLSFLEQPTINHNHHQSSVKKRNKRRNGNCLKYQWGIMDD